MAKYKVRVTELLSRVIEVEAESYNVADDVVREMYDAELIVLDETDFLDVDFTDEEANEEEV